LRLPTLITGKQAVEYYRILVFTFVDFVKNYGLQPYTEIGEPVTGPYSEQIERKLDRLRDMGMLLRRVSERPNSPKYSELDRFKLKEAMRAIRDELEALDYKNENADRSWKYLDIPIIESEKEKFVSRLLSYYYRPEDIEEITGRSASVDEPVKNPVDQSEGNGEDTLPNESMTPSEKRHLAILKEQKANFPKIIKAAVFATGYCIHSPTKVTRDALYDALVGEFKDLITKENFEWIRSGIKGYYEQNLQKAGRGSKKVAKLGLEDE
jgi:hypothetical protein